MIRLLPVIVLAFAFFAVGFAQDARHARSPGILIAFFSHTNNTRVVAEEIHRRVGGDMFHIATRKPYPQNHQQTVNVAREERDKNLRPELTATIPVEDMQRYDVVFIGYPNWWMTMPMAVRTFLDQYDLSGKTIVPFCTHEGSGLSDTVNEIRQMSPNANVLQGLAVNGRMASKSQNDVTGWLRALRFIR